MSDTVHTPAPTSPAPSRSAPDRTGPASPAVTVPQYSLRRILTVWAAAALPMAGLAWLVAPGLAGALDGPSAWPRAIVTCLTIGLVWQFVLVMFLVHREQGTLRWTVLKEALWLRAPQSPKSGRRGGRLWLLLLPLIAALTAKEMLPHLTGPETRDMGLFLESTAGQDFFSGNWPWFAAVVVMMVFNTVLGEELLFRGLLLPRMEGVFGRRDWVANGVLFGLYHLHVPWVIPATLIDTFYLSYPAKRYRSAVISIAVHSTQTVVFAALLLALVLS